LSLVMAACAPAANTHPCPEVEKTRWSRWTTAAEAGKPAEEPAATEGGEVYYLNFKPEVAELYQKLARLTKRKLELPSKL
jgi:alpha-glucuronidase